MSAATPNEAPEGFLQRGLGNLALFAYRRAALVLVAAAILTGGSMYAASFLKVDADLSELLPDSLPSVRQLDALVKRFGGVGYVVVVASGAEVPVLKKFADELAPKLEQHDQVAWVEVTQPVDFFIERGLLFLDTEDLKLVEQRLATRLDWEKGRRNPLYVNLDDDGDEDAEPPSIEFPEIMKKQSTGSSDTDWISRQGIDPYYVDEESKMIVLLVKPDFLSADLQRAKQIVNEVRTVVETIDLAAYDPNLKVGYSGRYTRKVEQQQLIESDLGWTTLLSLALVLFYLILHFRRGFAVALVAIPLVLGLIWTYGLTAIVFTKLNVLTSFVGVILLGLGIDHGIHLLGRFESEIQGRVFNHEQLADLIRRTFAETGRAVGVAAVTTMAGFASLRLSEFKPFREFGVMAAIGVGMVVLSYCVVLPALLSVADTMGWKPRGHKPMWKSRSNALLQRFARPFSIITAALVIFGGFNITNVSFNYDFSTLAGGNLPSFELEKAVNDILGYSESPAVILTTSKEEERYITEELRKHRQELEAKGLKSTVDFVASRADLVPENQEEKIPLIRAIDKIFKQVKLGWVPKDKRDLFKRVRKAGAAEPFDEDDLPAMVQRQFTGINAKPGEGFVLIFPAISQHDGSEVVRFAEEVRNITLPNGQEVSASGEDMILADVIGMIRAEGWPVLFTTLGLVLLTLLVLMRDVRAAATCFITAVGTVVVTLGLLPIMGMRLNYLNIVMIPVLFGIAVDGGVHIMSRLKETGDLGGVMTDTGRAIVGAILTTGLGFGALTLASHPGLQTLGRMTIFGLVINLIACRVALPCYLVLRGYPLQRDDTDGKDETAPTPTAS